VTDDRDLERYLKGDSALSRRYRDGSRETPPRDVDEAILAHARAEARRKRSAMRWLTPVALAASMVLGVNLAWNVYRHAPLPEAARNAEPAAPAESPAPVESPAPAALAGKPNPKAERDEMRAAKAEAETLAVERKRAEQSARQSLARQEAGRADGGSRGAMAFAEPAPSVQALPAKEAARTMAEDRAAAAPPAPASAPPPALTEPQKIERLIQYVEKLPGALFIRNGSEHTSREAADHLRTKLKYAGDRVKTAEDFIRLCATESSMTHQPYRIRFADGAERNSADVLREQLKTMQ
jgi:hypothetical protein